MTMPNTIQTRTVGNTCTRASLHLFSKEYLSVQDIYDQNMQRITLQHSGHDVDQDLDALNIPHSMLLCYSSIEAPSEVSWPHKICRDAPLLSSHINVCIYTVINELTGSPGSPADPISPVSPARPLGPCSPLGPCDPGPPGFPRDPTSPAGPTGPYNIINHTTYCTCTGCLLHVNT